MKRKRVTQIFPFLLPLRIWQKNLFNDWKMSCDENKYASSFADKLMYVVSETKTSMINEKTGMDIVYQYNKVDNLKLASKTMNGIVIRPGETFSFCRLLRKVKKYGEYKEGLILIDNQLVASKGGGICQLSNMLYYLFLQSPLIIVERHGHEIKSFPNPDPETIEGIDATIHSGWLDLRVKNTTNVSYQIWIDFDDEYMYGQLLSDKKHNEKYTIHNANLKYSKKGNRYYEYVDVVRDIEVHGVVTSFKLYTEICEITYPLSNDIKVEVIE